MFGAQTHKYAQVLYKPPPGFHVFKLRVAGMPDTDFVEVEVSDYEIRSYEAFLEICRREFDIPCPQFIKMIRKIPSIRVRSDEDVNRFQTFESFEIILVDEGSEEAQHRH